MSMTPRLSFDWVFVCDETGKIVKSLSLMTSSEDNGYTYLVELRVF